MADGASTAIQHIGNSFFYPPNSSKPLFLNNLLHVSSIYKNLLSVSQFAKDNKVYFEFHPNVCFVKCQVTNNSLLKGSLNKDYMSLTTLKFLLVLNLQIKLVIL